MAYFNLKMTDWLEAISQSMTTQATPLRKIVSVHLLENFLSARKDMSIKSCLP